VQGYSFAGRLPPGGSSDDQSHVLGMRMRKNPLRAFYYRQLQRRRNFSVEMNMILIFSTSYAYIYYDIISFDNFYFLPSKSFLSDSLTFPPYPTMLLAPAEEANLAGNSPT
jgi:hypothetical protein